VSAGTVLRPVYGEKHGTQTLPPPQGQVQKRAPHILRERNERQLHQPRTQQASNNNTKGRPLRTADLAPRYHPLGGSHAKGVPNAESGNIASRNAPRVQVERSSPLISFGVTTPAMAQQVGQKTHARVEIEAWHPGLIHAPAKMAGCYPELSSWQARNHPFGEGYRQAGTVLGHVQGREQGIQPSPESKGHQQKRGPNLARNMHEG